MDKKTLDEALDKSRETFKLFELEFNEEMNKFIDSLNEEQREYIVCWVLKKLNKHMTEGGSYRTMVYDLFNLPGSYMTDQISGGLEVHNALIDKYYQNKEKMSET